MVDNKQIVYRKELPPKATKQLGRGGPRDMQRRQGVGSASINMPKIDMEALKEVLLNNKEAREELKVEIRKEMNEVKDLVDSSRNIEGLGLPFDVVEQKIKEAVEHTTQQVRQRYESGIGSLNSQLNAAKGQIKSLNTQVDQYVQECNTLKEQIITKDKKIEEKDRDISDLRSNQNDEVGELKLKIMDLIDKIKSGKITQYDYHDDRPVIDEKIFIDPISEVVTELDSHINVDVSIEGDSRRDMKADVAKLKNLLDNKKFKPTSISINE